MKLSPNMFWPQVTKRVILSPTSTSSSGVLGRRFSSPKTVSCQLFLFQKTVMLCKTTENLSEPQNPHLLYDCHIRYLTISLG